MCFILVCKDNLILIVFVCGELFATGLWIKVNSPSSALNDLLTLEDGVLGVTFQEKCIEDGRGPEDNA